MEEPKIIAISHMTEYSEIHRVGRSGKFKFIPAVDYTVNNSPTKLIKYQNPFQLYPPRISMELLVKYSKPDIKKEEFKIAQTAYRKLHSFASRCADRIIADLICGVILQHFNQSEDVICIIQKPPSDKILGRLGYLYLPIERLTICFISWKPEDLMTNVIGYRTGRLQFDLHRLLLLEKEDLIGPYPGNPTESLKQTYFYNPPTIGEKKPFPIRIDIFSQGLLESDYGHKEKILRELLQKKNLVPPFEVEEGVWVQLPKGLKDCVDMWKRVYKKLLNLELKKEEF